MKVREVVKKSAELLNIELDKNSDKLVSCYNLVELDLSMQYLPLRAVDKVSADGDDIFFRELKHDIWKVLNVYDFQNMDVKYTILEDKITVKKNYNGRYFFVKYNYVPKDKTIDDSCEYDGRRKNLLVYGVCCEYCEMIGLREASIDFYMLHYDELRKILVNRGTKHED